MSIGKATHEYPSEFYCPISHCIMLDPVMDREGNTYERASIEQWLSEHNTSPITRNSLNVNDLAINRALVGLIEAELERRGDELELEKRKVWQEQRDQKRRDALPCGLSDIQASVVAKKTNSIVQSIVVFLSNSSYSTTTFEQLQVLQLYKSFGKELQVVEPMLSLQLCNPKYFGIRVELLKSFANSNYQVLQLCNSFNNEFERIMQRDSRRVSNSTRSVVFSRTRRRGTPTRRTSQRLSRNGSRRTRTTIVL